MDRKIKELLINLPCIVENLRGEGVHLSYDYHYNKTKGKVTIFCSDGPKEVISLRKVFYNLDDLLETLGDMGYPISFDLPKLRMYPYLVTNYNQGGKNGNKKY